PPGPLTATPEGHACWRHRRRLAFMSEHCPFDDDGSFDALAAVGAWRQAEFTFERLREGSLSVIAGSTRNGIHRFIRRDEMCGGLTESQPGEEADWRLSDQIVKAGHEQRAGHSHRLSEASHGPPLVELSPHQL